MTIITYLFQVTAGLAFFYAFYLIALQRETTFQTNRVYLMLTLVMSLVFPLIKIYVDHQTQPAIITTPTVFISAYMTSVEGVMSLSSSDQKLTWPEVFQWIYFAGILLMSIRLLGEVMRIMKLRKSGVLTALSEHPCVLSDEIRSPFSFFRTIYLPQQHGFTDDELAEVLNHENAHVRGLHTFDMLLVEVVNIILWPSPMIYLYRKKVVEVHEFLADAAVIKSSPWESYAQFLVSQKNFHLQNRLSNHLVYSQLKKRLVMMTQSPSPVYRRIKYLGIIPVLLLTLLMFSFREKTTADPLHNPQLIADTFPALYITAMRTLAPTGDTSQPLQNNSLDPDWKYTRELPVFPGCENVPFREMGECGMMKMTDFINENMIYPATLKKANIEGRVIVRFIVGADGFIKNAAVEKTLHPDADRAALEMVNSMNKKAGKWIPAAKEGKVLDAEMWLPITFTLGNLTTQESPQEVFQFVEEMPGFPGCEHLTGSEKSRCMSEALFGYLARSILYPKEEREKNIEGTVIVKFLVGADGNISNARVLRGVSPGLDEEALRVVNEMNELPQKWNPGKHNGKAVAVEFTIPFKFVLQANQASAKDEQVEKEPQQPINESEFNKSVGESKLYPNPVDISMNVEVFEGAHTIKIFDINGRQHIMQKIPSGEFHSTFIINISNLTEGQYILQVISDHKTESMKFGVKR